MPPSSTPNPAAAPGTPTPKPPVGVVAVFAFSLVALVVAVAAWGLGSRPPRPYAADTPEALLDSMAAAVRDQRADRLVELIELIPPEESTEHAARARDLSIRAARVLASAQRLGDTLAERFEADVERARGEFASSRRGSPSGPISALLSAASSQGSRPDPERRDRLARALGLLLADPYAAIEEGRDRLTTFPLDDRTVALLYDERPILPPVGLTARLGDDGRWRLVAPTSLPGVERFLPRSASEYAIWGSLLATVERLLDDLRRRVLSGELASLDAVAGAAVRDAVVPMGMVMIAYDRAMEERAGAREGP